MIQKAIDEAEAQGTATNQAVLDRWYAMKEQEPESLLKRPTSSRAASVPEGSQQTWHQVWTHDWQRRREVADVPSNIELRVPKVALNLGKSMRPTTLRSSTTMRSLAPRFLVDFEPAAWDDEDHEEKFDQPLWKEDGCSKQIQRGHHQPGDAFEWHCLAAGRTQC